MKELIQSFAASSWILVRYEFAALIVIICFIALYFIIHKAIEKLFD